MAVAVKTSAEPAQGRLLMQHPAVRCLLGALYLLLAVGTIFTGLPKLWNDVLGISAALDNPFLSDALLLIALVVAVGVFLVVGRLLEGSQPPRGLRAGSVFGAVGLFVIGLITLGLGNSLRTQEEWISLSIPVVVAAGLLYGLGWVYARPAFIRWLGHLEDNGWFHITPFKPSQGVRVRRGTVFALLVMILWGMLIMINHEPLGHGTWAINFPWNDSREVPILLQIQYTVPLFLLIVLGWISWRVVNWPVFADFLIATEAEMNKVSWTTRRRLVQDTIVVLVTVFLLTTYLFGVDYMWVTILKWRPIHVLQIDTMQERAKLNEKTQW